MVFESMSAATPQRLFQTLEERILFDAAMPTPESDAAVQSDAEPQTADVATADPASFDPSVSQAESEQVQTVRRELVIIDPAVENHQALIADLTGRDESERTLEVILLDADRSGIEQISEILADRNDLDALHIISHGEEGAFRLGSDWVDSQSLTANAAALASWGDALTNDGDILLYGCDVAGSSQGRELVDDLATLTGADVAASDDDTGSQGRGGDWQLEWHQGSIETSLAPSEAFQSSYQYVLAAGPVVQLNGGDTDVQIGEDFTFDLNFENTGSDVGFGPIVDLFFPATGADGDDGIEFNNATYLGTVVNSTVVTFGNDSHGFGVVEHPYFELATNETQAITIDPATGNGTFTISFDGETTGEIDHDASAASIQSQLESLSTINAGDISVTGDLADGYVLVEFVGAQSETDVASLVVDSSNLVGGVAAQLTVNEGSDRAVKQRLFGRAGDQLVSLELPFGSFSPGQPAATIQVSASLSELADVDQSLVVGSRAGFRFGEDPVDNPDADAVLISDNIVNLVNDDASTRFAQTQTFQPTLLTLSKTFNGPENELATGPNHQQQYQIVVDIADGQTIQDLDIIDSLPENVVVTSIDSVTVGGVAAGFSDNLSSLTTPGANQELIVRLNDDVTGGTAADDVVLTFSFFIDEFDASGDRVIPVNGEDDTISNPDSRSINNARTTGIWSPIDTRDPQSITVIADPVGDEHVLDAKAIAIQKDVRIANETGATGATPGDTLEYTLTFQISDFYTFGDLLITDVFQDGQRFDFGFGATFDITDANGTVTGSFTVREVTDADGGQTLVVDQTRIDETDNASENPISDGSTTLTFDLSKVLTDNGAADGILQGGLTDGASNQGAATGTIRFRTVIQEEYSDTFLSGDRSVDQGDEITNLDLTISGTVRENLENDDAGDGFAPQERVIGNESDMSSESISIQGGTLSKSVYSINGNTNLPTNPDSGRVILVAGDIVTYRVNYTLSASDFENLVITDFLPLPVFDATDHDADGNPNAGPAFGWSVDVANSFDDVPPASSGVIEFGENDTFFGIGGVTPTINVDASANSISLDFGNFDDSQSRPSEIELYISVTASDLPTADGLFLTNQVRASEGTTQQDSNVLDSIIQVEITQPVLAIQKGVVATSRLDGTTTESTDLVTFDGVGSAGTFTGTITSGFEASDPNGPGQATGLRAFSIDDDATGLEAGDRVRYAIVIENFGLSSRGAHDVTITDQLPPGFDFVAGSLRVVDGTGADHSFVDANAGNPGLFGDGIVIDDPGPTPDATGVDAGSIDGNDPASGRNILVVLYDVEISQSAEINQTHTNTAEITNFASKEGGQNHAAGLIDTANVETRNFTGAKTIVSTDQSHTIAEDDGSGTLVENVTIGETIRYRIEVEVPQGSLDNFIIRDLLPGGLTYLNDGTAAVALISNGGLTSSTLSGPGLTSIDPTIQPTFLLPDDAVSQNIVGNSDNFATGTDVFFKLGDVVNNDGDVGAELVILEFNVVVDNNSSGDNQNDASDDRFNSFRVQSGASADFQISNNDRPLVRIVEPSITRPTISSNVNDVDAGDTIQYTIDFGVVDGAAQSDAFDVISTVMLPDNFTLDSIQSITIGGVVVNSGDARYPAVTTDSGQLTFAFDRLDEGEQVEIVYAGTVDGTIRPDDTLTTNATLTWTSLPIDTGSGTATGQRDGSGESSAEPNDYFQTQSQDVNVDAVGDITKTLLGTEIVTGGNGNTQAVIGELVTYELVVDFPEASVPDSIIVDQLDTGLAFFDVISTSDSGITFSGSLTPTYDASTHQLTFDLGDVSDIDTTDNNGGQLTIRYRAIVLNDAGNQSGTGLNNSATYTWGNNSANDVVDTADNVTVVEPAITLDQSISIAGNAGQTAGDAGDSISYTIELTNTGGVDAFDIGFINDLPTIGGASAIVGVTFDVNDTASLVSASDFTLSGSDSAGYSLQYTGGDAWDILQSQTGRTITITVDGNISNSVTPNADFTNNPRVDWSSLDGDIQNRTANDADSDERSGTDLNDTTADYIATDAITFSIRPPEFVKLLESTNQTETTLSNVTIGEQVVYRLLVSLPEGQTPGLVIVDELPDGLDYLSHTIDTAGFAGTINTPTVTGGDSDGDDVTFTFGSITTNVDNDGSNNSFSILITAVVTDNVNNTGYTGNQTTLRNTATIDITGDGVGPASSNDVDVTVVESDLNITKNVDLDDVNARDLITVTLDVENIGPHGAFEVDVQDILDAAIYDLGSVNFTTTAAGFTAANNSGTITYTGGDIASGATATFQFTVRINDDVAVGQTVTNTATIQNATTLDGTESGERNQTDSDGDNSDTDDDQFDVREHSLDGFVFFDADNDGVFDAGESGIDGVTIELTGTDHLGRTITPRSIVTGDGANPDGFYQFDDLRPGTYTITQIQPTVAANGKDYLDGSDTIGDGGGNQAANDVFGGIVLSTNNQDGGSNYNFGELEEAELSGIVYHDANSNGVFDVGELGIGGVTVTLTGTDDQGVITPVVVITGADGVFAFDQLRPGEYRITQTQPTFAAPSGRAYADQSETDGSLANGDITTNDQIGSINVAAGVTGIDYRFGEVIESVVSGYVFNDVNNDGDRSDGLPISGATIRIQGTDDLGNAVNRTANTDADGFYQFANLRPSDASGYTISQVTQPAGFLDGNDTVGSQGGTLGNDVFTDVVVRSDTDGSENNFGELRPNSLEGFVFNDRDDDGNRDAGEEGIASVTLRLTGTDDRGDAVDTTVQTDSNGRYEFVNIRPSGASGYTITQTQPVQFNDGIHSDGSLGNGDDSVANQISSIDFVENGSALDYNFGERGATISGTVFFDDNRDGSNDAGETTGIGSVRIELYDASGTTLIESTDTLADGSYQFTDLAAGDYVIRQIQPGQFTSTSADQITATLPTSGLADQDFGETQFDITGLVHWDINGDGNFVVADDVGLSGVNVTLQVDRDGDGIYEGSFTTTTDSDGNYEFLDQPGANYRVVVTPPAGTTQTGDPDAMLDDQSTFVVGLANLPTPQVFGYQGNGSIGDRVFFDYSGDGGVFDASDNDRGFGGVDVTLAIDVNGDSTIDHTRTTQTAADGTYQFDNLIAGDYTITVDSSDIPDQVGDNPTFNADATIDNQTVVTLVADQANTTTDFGFHGRPDYEITVDDGNQTVVVGQNVTHTITLRNNGTFRGQDVVVVADYPNNVLENVTASNGGVVDVTAGTITWTLPVVQDMLPTDDPITLTIQGDVVEILDGDNDPLEVSVSVSDNQFNGIETELADNVDNDIDQIVNLQTIKNVVGVVANGDVFDVTFEIQVRNTGSVRLDDLTLVDDLSNQFGARLVSVATPTIVSQSAIAPTLNAAWTGNTSLDIFDPIATDEFLDAGDALTVTFVATIDPDQSGTSSALFNSATAGGTDRTTDPGTPVIVTDDSDGGTSFTSTNPGAAGDMATEDDPTQIYIADIAVAKQQTSVVQDPVTRDYNVGFTVVVENIGTVSLDQLSLIDDVASRFGDAFVEIQAGSLSIDSTSGTGTFPSVNSQWESDTSLSLIDGSGAVLDAGDSFVISFNVIVDPDGVDGFSDPITNQANASGRGLNETGNPLIVGGAPVVAADLSDSGLNPNTTNGGEDGDTGSSDDPTPVVLPEIGAAKRLVSSTASAGGGGNRDLTYEVIVRNLGTVSLTNIDLVEDLRSHFGGAFVSIVDPPVITASTASDTPVLAAWDGDGQANIFTGTSGTLDPGDQVVVRFTVEVDIDQLTASSNNQVEVAGDYDVRPLVAGIDGTVTDLSDTGTNPAGNNPGQPGDTGGFDDPTLVPAIGVSLDHGDAVEDTDVQHFLVPVTISVENLGATDLASVQVFQDLAAAYGDSLLGVSNVRLQTSGVTGSPPILNSDWEADPSLGLLEPGTGNLNPGDRFTITFDVLVDPDADGSSDYSQAQTRVVASDPSNPTATVTDVSDSGDDTSGTNPGQPGDTSTADDATPLQIADIAVAKSISSATQLGLTYELAIDLVIENTGTVDLVDLELRDDLADQYGANFSRVLRSPQIIASDAAIDPVINQAFRNDTSLNLFDGVTGMLRPGESLTIRVIVEVESVPGQTEVTLVNQAIVSAAPLDENGLPLRDQAGTPVGRTEDLSDSGVNPNTTNVGAPGDAGTFDDPTPVTLSFFTFDAFNDFSQNRKGLLQSGRRDSSDPFGNSTDYLFDRPEQNQFRSLSRSISQLAPDPIFSGSARPGTQIIGRVYDSSGTLLGEEIALADVGGNWMMQFHGTPANPTETRIEFVEMPSTAEVFGGRGGDGFGYLGLDNLNNDYASLEPWTSYGHGSEFTATLRPMVSTQIAQWHRQATRPLGLGR